MALEKSAKRGEKPVRNLSAPRGPSRATEHEADGRGACRRIAWTVHLLNARAQRLFAALSGKTKGVHCVVKKPATYGDFVKQSKRGLDGRQSIAGQLLEQHAWT